MVRRELISPVRRLAPAVALLGLIFGSERARADERTTPWTTSRLAGTPEPPPPFTVEPAFPKLRFQQPIALVAASGSRRVLVAELGGKVLSFENDSGTDRSDLAMDLAEARPGFSALYGIAFHPRFEGNRHVFLCYNVGDNKPDGTRVSRFSMTRDDPPRIEPASERVLLTWLSGGHNGGCLQFGRDGCLYISTGDAASPSPPDPLETGQDLGDLLSSVLRIDVDREEGGKAYRIPLDNPFLQTEGARPEIWAYGFRNPWRMSFDRETGDLWVGDVGWELWEMIYRVERGGNYGWSIVEGRQPVRPEGRRGPTPIHPPVVDHPHSEAASITGGYVYRGRRLKDLDGAYIYGDFQSGKVWALRHDGQKVTWKGEVANTDLRLVSFGEDQEGELYLLDFERTNGIYRLVPNRTQEDERPFPRALSQTGLFASTAEHRPAPGVVPYSIRAEMWSDGARAERFLAVPGSGRIEVTGEGSWNLPEGSVLARTVSMDLVPGDPRTRRRVETQILHREAGTWRPYTYAWDDAQRDATLVDAAGTTRTLSAPDGPSPARGATTYRIAARSECLLCHNPWAGGGAANYGRQSASPLGFNAAQLGRQEEGTGEDSLRLLQGLGYFQGDPRLGHHAALADPYDETADLERRARSYLHVNCSHCHQANAGGTTTIALLASLKPEETRTVGHAPIQGSFGLPDARIIAPGEPERSVLYYRMAKTGAGRMPRIGSQRVDQLGTRMIADWIARMPRPDHAEAMPSEDADALKLMREGAAAGRSDALRRLTGSTRGALSLVRQIDRGEVSQATAREAAFLSKDGPAEVGDLFERFLPEAERIRRLGDEFDDAAVLDLPGDPERGRTLFFAESATQCKTCHRVGGAGSNLGPDLDAIGTKYPRTELLRHIRQPSLVVEAPYAPLVIATKDGRTLTGLPHEETADEVVLRDAQDRFVRIRKTEIEQRDTLATSLMPEGLLRDLTAQQAADLLEFLSSRKDPGRGLHEHKVPLRGDP